MTFARLQLVGGKVVQVPLGQFGITENNGAWSVGVQLTGQPLDGAIIEGVWCGGAWVDPSWEAIDRAALESLGVGAAVSVGGRVVQGLRGMLATQLDTRAVGG